MWALIRAFCYIAITGGCIAALYAGTAFLVTPNGTVAVSHGPPPIPPRIAESIERRVPVPARELPAPASPQAMPPLQQATASLPIIAAQPRHAAATERRVRRPVAKQGAMRPSQLATQNSQSQEYRAPSAVTTARSDVPY